LIALVPVERIELPTFGLQNRCSTAELNRLTGGRDQGIGARTGIVALSSEALERQARRQIPELSAKGYSLATRAGTS
jgi:hypothetical protein